MVKIDKKDKKLLYYLSINARSSDSQLSKKLRLSKNAVKYRINRLVNNDIITKFATTINLGSIGYTTFTMLLKFNQDIYKDKSTLTHLKNHAYIGWAITLSGTWDVLVEIVSKDFNHFHQLVRQLITHYGSQLNTFQVLFSFDTLRVEHLVSDFYKETKLPEIPSEQRTTKEYKLDSADRKILHTLSKDSSLSYQEIAKYTNLSADVVRYRIKKLIKQKTIIKFFAEPSLPSLGYTEFLYIMQLRDLDKNTLANVKAKIKSNANITYAFIDTNSLSIVLVCAYKDAAGIDQLSRSLRNKYNQFIESQQYLLIKEHLKFNLFPDGLLD